MHAAHDVIHEIHRCGADEAVAVECAPMGGGAVFVGLSEEAGEHGREAGLLPVFAGEHAVQQVAQRVEIGKSKLS